MRKSLIVIQFAASFVLIAGTFVVIKQVKYMQRETTSSMFDRILVVKYPFFTENISEKIESFKKQLKQNPHIEQVSVSGAVPGVEVANYFTNRLFGSDQSETKLIQMFSVDYDYLETYSPEVISGRLFSEDHGGELNNIVLNEEAVRLLGFSSNEEVLGKRIEMEVLQEPLEVIGVVKNYYQQSLNISYKPIIFFIKERVPFISTPYISIKMDRTIDPESLKEVELTFKTFFPDTGFTCFSLNDFNDNQYKNDRSFSWVFACTSLLAIFVAGLGLWIIMLFSSLSRSREIGIRKILGADKMTLFTILTKESILLVTISSVIGIPVSVFLMNKWLESYAFHISLPSWIYIVTFVFLLCIALLSIIRLVWRTIRINPIHVLRAE